MKRMKEERGNIDRRGSSRKRKKWRRVWKDGEEKGEIETGKQGG